MAGPSSDGPRTDGSPSSSYCIAALQRSARISTNKGWLPTSPVNVNINGTALPTVSGSYTGPGNDNFTFTVLGSGTVGTTVGLQLEVRNSANNVVATLNIGAGYTPGTALTVGNGVSVVLSAGTSNGGTFAIPVTAQPDTTGLLAALGVNALFTGNGATTIGVNTALVADPGLLAVSRSGQPGDASNLERFAGLRDAQLLNGATQTFGQYFDALTGDVGSTVRGLDDLQSAVDALQQHLFAQEQSVTGVDVNEESVNLVQYQRLIEASSRYLNVVNSALDTILQIVR